MFRYAIGRLAVWVPRTSTLPIEAQGLRALAAPEVRHVAIANPRHAPYGRAAKEALRAAGVPVEAECFAGQIHTFFANAHAFPEGMRAVETAAKHLRAAFANPD